MTGKVFRPGTSRCKFLRGRLSEGKSVEDLLAIIRFKVEEWGADEKMRKYLRPETLFAKDHFETYLEEARESGQGSADIPSGQAEPGYDMRGVMYAWTCILCGGVHKSYEAALKDTCLKGEEPTAEQIEEGKKVFRELRKQWGDSPSPPAAV